MKQFLNKVMICSLVILLLASVQVFASGSNRAGTNAASELLIPVGARYIAMGGASAAMVNGLESMYWNPAGLDRMNYSAGAMFSYMTYIADINMSYVAGAAKFGGLGTVGLNMKALDFGEIPITTEDAPDGTGALFSPQFITVGLTYSRGLTDRVSVGATATLISETIDRVNATGFAFDIGVQYRNLGNINGLNIGLVVKNLGPGMQFDGNGLLRNAKAEDVTRTATPFKVVAGKDELPSTMEIGLSYVINVGETSSLNISSAFVNNNYQDDVSKLGAEYSFNDMFFIRGGYGKSLNGTEDAAGESIYIYGATFGAGFHYDLGGIDLVIDYAYRDVNFFDSNNVFTIKLGF